ncbi:MAG: hydrogenase maturation protease [Anaerolineales bacterium]
MPQDQLSSSKLRKTLILGVGNILKGDDGLGVRVAQVLSQRALPPDVIVEEIGTPGLDLVTYIEGWEKVIIIDAVEMGEIPGTWKRFTPEEVKLIAGDEVLSLHEPNIADVLELGQALNILPDEIVVYGVQPQDLTYIERLSPQIEAIINNVADQILLEIWK